MKKIVIALVTLVVLTSSVYAYDKNKQYAIYRLYEPNSGAHYLTGAKGEVFTLTEKFGWICEGVAWYAPMDGTPLYVLYNPNNGDYIYTPDSNEQNHLVQLGWEYSGYYDCGGSQPVYRLYSPAIQWHLYTTGENEYNELSHHGWNQEGIAFYSIPLSSILTY